MTRRHWLISFLIGITALARLAIPAQAASSPGWLDGKGFRELRWGATVEQAQVLVPDLEFIRYAPVGSDERETPAEVYQRKAENRTIDGVEVDKITYWFQNRTLIKVVATMDSKLGPRTLVTRASKAFDDFQSRVSAVAGKPADYRAKSDGSRRAVWHWGEMTVTLRCFEPQGTNDDDLILEVEKKLSPRIEGKETK